MKQKISVCFTILVILTALFSSCGSKNNQNDMADTQGAKQKLSDVNSTGPVRDSVTAVYFTSTETIDPYASTNWEDQEAFIQIYDPLVGIAPETGKPEMKLAEDLTISDDGLEYLFAIRKGVKFSNGEELTADDVKFSFEQALKSPRTNSKLGNVKELKVVDEYTFKIILSEPYASFKKILAYMFIVNKDAFAAAGETYGDDISNYVGTGAYIPTDWEKGQFIKMKANENYYEGVPPIRNLEFKAIAEPGTASIALESKEVDLVNNLGTDFIEIAEENNDIELISTSGAWVKTIIMNTMKPPFDDTDFRMAVAYACDREAMNTAMSNGYYETWYYYLEENSGGLAEDIKAPEYNLDKAKEYLEKSGYGDGVEISMQGIGTVTLLAEVLQSDLAKIGVTLNLEAVETGTAYDNIFSGNYQICAFLATNVTYDGDMLYRWYSANSTLNTIHYQNNEYENILAEARSTIDEEKRNALYRKAQEIVRDNALIIPIYNEVQYTAHLKGIKNLKLRPDLHTEYIDLSW